MLLGNVLVKTTAGWIVLFQMLAHSVLTSQLSMRIKIP